MSASVPGCLAPAGERFFVLPVVHHHASSAAQVRQALAAHAFDLVAVQLPRDAEPLLPHLRRVSRWPVAICRLPPEPRTAATLLPLPAVSPEREALLAPCRVAFVDAALGHSFPASSLELGRCAQLAGALGCRDLHELTDRLALQGRLDLLFTESRPTAHDRLLADGVSAAAGDATKVLVVVGVAHAAAVRGLLAAPSEAPGLRAAPPGAPEPCAAPPSKLYLVPMDEPRLHRAGAARFPRWQRLLAGEPSPERLLAQVAAELGELARRAGLQASVPDGIELAGLARQLATLRDLAAPGLYELLDALRLAAVRYPGPGGVATDLGPEGPFGPLGPVLAEILVGRERGEVPRDVPCLPLLDDYRGQLAALGGEELLQRGLTLEVVRSPAHRAQSRFLHQLRLLELPGLVRLRGPDLASGAGAHLLTERWLLRRPSRAEGLAQGGASLTELQEETLSSLATWGHTVAEVAAALLRERAADRGLSLTEATGLLLGAVQLGLDALIPELALRVRERLQRGGALTEIAAASERLGLAALAPCLGQASPLLAALAGELFARSLQGFEGQLAEPSESELCAWLLGLRQTTAAALAEVAARARLEAAVRDAEAQGPAAAGALVALRMLLGVRPGASLPDLLPRVLDAYALEARALGRFVAGFLALGAGAALAEEALLSTLSARLAAWDEAELEAVLPHLRFAFATLAPDERRRLSRSLAPPRGSTPGHIDVEAVRAAWAGLGLDPGLPSAPPPAAPERPAPDATPPSGQLAERWRLLLGEEAGLPLAPRHERKDAALSALYGQSGLRRRGSSPHPSPAEALEWLAALEGAFDGEAKATLVQHAIERFGLLELLSRPELVRGLAPSLELVRALVRARQELPPETLAEARRLIRALAERLRPLFLRQLTPALGAVSRGRAATTVRSLRNLDAPRTVLQNLRYLDPETGELAVRELVFKERRQRHWRLVLLVDQSASMVDAQIQMAVLAGVFCAVPSLAVHVVAFDVEAHEVTAQANDPAELLLSRSPGGGTCIAPALHLAADLVSEPRRTLVVLLSDLGEGDSPTEVVAAARRLIEAGVHLIALHGLGPDHEAAVDPEMRAALVELGVAVESLTPAALARWLAERMR